MHDDTVWIWFIIQLQSEHLLFPVLYFFARFSDTNDEVVIELFPLFDFPNIHILVGHEFDHHKVFIGLRRGIRRLGIILLRVFFAPAVARLIVLVHVLRVHDYAGQRLVQLLAEPVLPAEEGREVDLVLAFLVGHVVRAAPLRIFFLMQVSQHPRNLEDDSIVVTQALNSNPAVPRRSEFRYSATP